MYGVSVSDVGFAAAAVARAGALGLDGRFGAVVGMIICIAPVPDTMAVSVISVLFGSTSVASGVTVWVVSGLDWTPVKIPIKVTTE